MRREGRLELERSRDSVKTSINKTTHQLDHPRQLRGLLEGPARRSFEKLGGRKNPRLDTPGPKLYPNIASIKHRTSHNRTLRLSYQA